jgi:medium-chain acyl-[acyl-carrier-protein] hydrolase
MALSSAARTTILTPWLACVKPNPQARLRLFCFPYAGGGASVFRTWHENLPASIEVCPVQIPGRETRLRDGLFNDISPLVQTMAPALLPYLDKPFAFFGHSMGALVAFELARHLRKQYGLEPGQLFVSGSGAPQIPDPDPPIHALSDAEFLEELRGFNGTPKEVLENAELVELMLPILRADVAAYETYYYRSEPPLGSPISAFGGLQDEKVSRERLQAWGDQTTAFFRLRMLPGDHFFLRTAQSLLLQTLAQELHELVRRLP